jgi:hypothetical protein
MVRGKPYDLLVPIHKLTSAVKRFVVTNPHMSLRSVDPSKALAPRRLQGFEPSKVEVQAYHTGLVSLTSFFTLFLCISFSLLCHYALRGVWLA